MTSAAHRLRQRIHAGDVLIGTFLNLGSPVAAEICGLGGLDWALLDLEHGTVHEADLLSHVLAAQAGGVPLLVRVEAAARPRIGRALDIGAAGIMAPRIDTCDEAREAIAHMHYGPHGDRGVASYNRACGFGTRVDAIADARERTTGIVQIESPAAVATSREIAALPGVDVLFVGPGDLTHAMGSSGKVDDPAFLLACREIVDAATAGGKVAGILVPNPERVGWALELGFRFIGVGSDATLLLAAARQARAALDSKQA
jgi:2-keto-3-deoxy-L-rhamnonate aldolase RhmA